MLDEIFSRTMLPAISYFFMGLLIFFWRFRSQKFSSVLAVIGLLMCALSFIRAVIGYLAKKKKINLLRVLPFLNLIVIVIALLWGVSLCLVIYESPINSLQLFVCFGITSSILAAIPSSLIGVPRIQMLFCVCLGLIPGLAYLYRFFNDVLPFDFLVLPALLFVNFFYVVMHSQKLRQSLLQLFDYQDRVQQDLAAAKDIQRSLLPSTNQEFENAKLNILYKPCEELSGDFFESYRHKDFLLFYIADVTSHGTAAAQVTYLLKGAFKNIIARLEDHIEIAEVTKQIAEDYVAYKLNYSVSLFIASYNLKNGSLQYVTSNFPNPLLFSNERIETLPSLDNPVIDASRFDHSREFKKATVQLGPGNRVFAFTDGAYEFTSKTGREFGIRKFSRILAENKHQEWTRSVEAALVKANGTPVFEDDITILCLSRTS